MGYSAEVRTVVIASPSDVSQERSLIREVIQEWNTIYTRDRRIVLMPVGWETHAVPEMGGRPQAIVNKQLLEEADLLVAVFWTRLGSPTGEADSGTVEEIEKHLAAGKPAMLYFSSAPVRLESVDAAQYQALRAFKDRCKSEGVIEEYSDFTEFRIKFSRQLAMTVNSAFSSSPTEDDRLQVVSELYSSPALSDAARELLLEASQDSNGMIMNLGSLSGRIIQTNNRGFVDERNARSEARWVSAIRELQGLGLIEDRSYKGEAFFVTDRGYQVADQLTQ
ncbi:MAG TPA: hypothetical protein VIY49_36850 [Bryobacteraceae bacterium]